MNISYGPKHLTSKWVIPHSATPIMQTYFSISVIYQRSLRFEDLPSGVKKYMQIDYELNYECGQ